MRRGCISLGEVECSRCHRIVAHSERYLVVDETDGVEDEKGNAVNYCVDCAQKKGYVTVTEEKEEKIISFFP